MNEDLQSISTLNIWENIFPKPPYNCVSRQRNPELEALENVIYQDDYDRVTCDTCECGLESYTREIQECPDNCNNERITETICKNDWLKLPKKPYRLYEFRQVVELFRQRESRAGIIHHLMRYNMNLEEMQPRIPVPKLEIRQPLDSE